MHLELWVSASDTYRIHYLTVHVGIVILEKNGGVGGVSVNDDRRLVYARVWR